jgi:hypothetical protein
MYLEAEEIPSFEVASETARTERSAATAVLAEAKTVVVPLTAPFGPSSGSPWGTGPDKDDTPTSTRQPSTPLPPLQAAVENVNAPREPSPSGQRKNPFANANPFAGGDATEVPNKQPQWVVILSVSAAVILTLALIISRL